MTRTEYLKDLIKPLPGAKWSKYPAGNIMQMWGENPSLYSGVFNQIDDLHKYLAGHSGIDIATFHRDPVYACQVGYVQRIRTDRLTLGGLCVYIQSPELEDGNDRVIIQHVYAHLDECVVKEGDYITRGQLIGYEGNTGFVISNGSPFWGTAPAGVGTHLHFGLYEFIFKNNAWVGRNNQVLQYSFDPLPWLTDPDPTDDKIEGDWSGTLSLLKNMASFLEYLKKKYFP